ncbi:hypothetical protein BGW36DRAFT_463821 [Talaromyces proteolyticus]|uniref:Uncharacterized protein n=1 Tax=Talaromyces proteolyticus TaxID=1131652 RepID=A0AAD4KNH8_9EURO|nr:uncharacterized protein BGW36DRAFT_463821 [Talaromyces proteolyticus]KAH8694265.1 hypothetical protein BGW36DRAFT_463821 [Talaromyces proteolyticus]
MTDNVPLFVAQEALCYYPISTIYDSCPRYLFYSLLLASCVTRWTGWLADVFLGTAATYAGTAAFQSFILVASPAKQHYPGPVTIPYISSAMQQNDTRLSSDDFPALVINADQVMVQPAALELDADAILAIVVTGYLVFLPLQCWSRVLSHNRARNILFCLWNALMLAGSICALVYWPTLQRTPKQYMFCYPDIPPFETTTSDGWQDTWRTSTWNESVWSTFSNMTKFDQLGDICYNPCFNTTQILRQQTSLASAVVSDSYNRQAVGNDNNFWDRVIYSRRYIYTLIVLCVILNCVLMTLKVLPYRSHIRSVQPVAIWRNRKEILNDLKDNFWEAVASSKPVDRSRDEENSTSTTATNNAGQKFKIRDYICAVFSVRFAKLWFRFFGDVAILIGLLFSIIISPFTVIAFVVWIEWYIRNDGPSQESPRQVGQWAYLLSIGLLLISAAVLKMKYRVASQTELNYEFEETRKHLEKLQRVRDERFGNTRSLGI